MKFLRSVFEEAAKLDIPEAKETYITALTVVAVIVVTALLIMTTDFFISRIIKILFGLGV